MTGRFISRFRTDRVEDTRSFEQDFRVHSTALMRINSPTLEPIR